MSEQTFLTEDFLDPKRKYWVLISGGKDSMATAHYLDTIGCLEGCIFIDTGICANVAKGFIESIHEYHVETVKTTESYENIVSKIGFPRYKAHAWTKDRLKGRAIRVLKKHHKNEPLFLASGTRRLESARRKRNARPFSKWEGLPVVSPLYNWTNSDVWSYVLRRGVRLSPTYAITGKSWECPCGAMAYPGERELMLRTRDLSDVRERTLTLEDKYGGLWGNAKAPTEGELRLTPFACQGDCATPPILEAVEPRKPW